MLDMNISCIYYLKRGNIMGYNCQRYLYLQSTAKLKKLLKKQNQTFSANNKEIIVGILKKRYLLKHKYPRSRLRKLPTTERDIILNTVLLDDDLVLIEPVVLYILSILRRRENAEQL